VHSPAETRAEDLGDLVGGQAPQTELAAALEQFVDREVAALVTLAYDQALRPHGDEITPDGLATNSKI